MVNALVEVSCKGPVNVAAIFVKTLLEFVSDTLLELRSIKPLVPKLMGALLVCEIASDEASVSELVANVAAGDQVNPVAPTVTAPAVLLPIRTFALRARFNEAVGNAKLPAPPATPIVLPEVLG